MPFPIFRRYAIYCAKTALLLAIPITFIYCAFGPFDGEDFASSFFAPEVSHRDDLSVFYRSLQILYKTDSVFNNNDFTTTNVMEWRGFFDNKVSALDLDELLYGDSDTRYIDTLIFHTKNSKYPISTRLKKNSLYNYENAAKKLEFLYYLGFAKRCEPYVTMHASDPYAYWTDLTVIDTPANEARQKLLASEKKVIASVKLPFVRQRYHFQVVRLFFMNADYDACIKYYQDNRKEIDDAGTAVIKYRTWSYLATAHYRKKEYAQANYLFSRIFDQMPIMQKTAIYYFHPMEEADWGECLSLAKTPHETAVLWAMTGIKHSDELRSMKEIYRIEPGSDVLDLLLVRLVNVYEETFLDKKYKLPAGFWGDGAEDSVIAVKEADAFISSVEPDTMLHNRALWYLCGGYIKHMNGQYEDAKSQYTMAMQLAPHDTLLNTQCHLLNIMANAELTSSLNLIKEKEILTDLRWLEVKRDSAMRQESAYKALRSILCNLYTRQNNPIMAELAKGFSDDHLKEAEAANKYYTDDSSVAKMIAFLHKSVKTQMEAYLVSKYEKNSADMIFYLGLEDLYKDSLTAAYNKWNMNYSLVAETLTADPFLIHIRDCHDCDQTAAQPVKYSRLNFLDKMISLERQIKNPGKDLPNAYFQLANGFYNITYYGNNRMMYFNYISPAIDDNDINDENKRQKTKSKLDKMDCSLALKYYLLARNASGDKNFKAKCTFMAAKCEHNMSSENYVTDNDAIYADADFGKYFEDLRDNYSNTLYQKELIRECSYFRYYMKHSR